MRWSRTLGVVASTATAVATALGIAAPAHAAYSRDPVSLPWHPAGPVHSAVSGNGVVYVGGKLDGVGGIAAIDAGSGSLLWQIPTDNDVRALALSADGSTLYAGGSFISVNGTTHRHLVAIDVAAHSVVSTWKGRARGQVRDLLVFGNTVYLAGKTTSVDGFAQRGLGAVDATTGARDASFTFSADDNAYGLALAGTRLLVSGKFTHINGVPRAELAAIDLSTNTLTSWAPAKLCSSCDQYWDVVTDGTNAYVGTSGNAAGAYNLVTGAQPWSHVSSDGDIQVLWLAGDGELYLGGHFGQALWRGTQNIPATVLGAVFTANGQIDTSFTPKIYKTYPGAWALTSIGGRLWIGGDFTGERVNAVNNHRPYLAAYGAI